jgi:hypothetical protein
MVGAHVRKTDMLEQLLHQSVFLPFHAAAEMKLEVAWATAGTQMLCVISKDVPYKQPTPVAQAAKAALRPPLLCSTPKTTPEMRTPRLQGSMRVEKLFA